MIIGIDMGGTNIDGVIISNKEIIKEIKRPVDKNNLYLTIINALKELLEDIDPLEISRVHLSTTISTNAIVENKCEEVLMVLQTGPGINYKFEDYLKNVEYITGYVNHQGKVVKDINLDEIKDITSKYPDINSLGVVTKFSTRNPETEEKIYSLLKEDFEYISLGHSISGNLNFPRRVNSAYLNSSVSKVFRDFATNISRALKERNIQAPIYILKADGGTMPLDFGINKPIESILSGPAASFMGITALENSQEDSIFLDIGGTTTDIFFLVDGTPIFEPKGIEINGYKTLVKGVFSYSIGLGGDSLIKLDKGELKIGPERKGFPLALGGKYPTLTDAYLILEDINFGDKNKSIEGISNLAKELNMDVEDFSKKVLELSTEIIFNKVMELLEKINSKPLFTVREVLENRKIIPKEIKIIGGPAITLASYIQERFNIKTKAIKYSNIANAIGAALSRPTFEINLFADTRRKILSIPEVSVYKNINPNFNLVDGEKLVFEILEGKSKEMGYEDSNIEIVEKESFNMVEGYSFGRNIRIKGQISPGLIYDLRGDENEG